MVPSDIPHLVRHLLEKHGLRQRGWTFGWDHARVRAGCCKHGQRKITLSRHYVAMNIVNGLDEIIDTILHEIAHALVGGGHGHDGIWKAKCVEIGANPQRCYDAATVAMPKGRHVATCGGCGRQFSRHKRLRRGSWRYCTACGPDKGRLLFVDSKAKKPLIHRPPVTDEPPPPDRLE